jgi:hypothetical protein
MGLFERGKMQFRKHNHEKPIHVFINGQWFIIQFIDNSAKDYGYASYEVWVTLPNLTEGTKIGTHVCCGDDCIKPQVKKIKRYLKRMYEDAMIDEQLQSRREREDWGTL